MSRNTSELKKTYICLEGYSNIYCRFTGKGKENFQRWYFANIMQIKDYRWNFSLKWLDFYLYLQTLLLLQ